MQDLFLIRFIIICLLWRKPFFFFFFLVIIQMRIDHSLRNRLDVVV